MQIYGRRSLAASDWFYTEEREGGEGIVICLPTDQLVSDICASARDVLNLFWRVDIGARHVVFFGIPRSPGT